MNLRKLLGMPTEAQEKQIKQDMELILERCAKIIILNFLNCVMRFMQPLLSSLLSSSVISEEYVPSLIGTLVVFAADLQISMSSYNIQFLIVSLTL